MLLIKLCEQIFTGQLKVSRGEYLKSLPLRCSHAVCGDWHTSHWLPNSIVGQVVGGEHCVRSQRQGTVTSPLGWFGNASSAQIFTPLWNLLNFSRHPPICTTLTFLLCVPGSEHTSCYRVCDFLPVSLLCTRKVSCFLCCWVPRAWHRVGSCWTVWWTYAQTNRTTKW